jgi:MFS family permease
MTQVWGFSLIQTGLGVTPGPLLVAILAPRFGRLASRVGQRPLIITGGVVYAIAGVWRFVILGAEPRYWTEFFPSMFLTGVGIALTVPQLSSTIAQALPMNRTGVGGAVHQAIRQFGGTLGVAFTIALISRPQTAAESLANFDRVWALLVIGGLLSSVAALRLVTPRVAAAQDPNASRAALRPVLAPAQKP